MRDCAAFTASGVAGPAFINATRSNGHVTVSIRSAKPADKAYGDEAVIRMSPEEWSAFLDEACDI